MKRLLIRVCEWFRELTATHMELIERHQLLNHPWEEHLLHWSHDGQRWRLHGHLVPPPDKHRRSTTRTGWCPAVAAQSRPLPPPYTTGKLP